MKRIILFLIGIMVSANMLADVVDNYEYEGYVYSYDTYTNKATLTGLASTNTQTALDIPGTIQVSGDSYTVTAIGNEAFRDNLSIEKVTIHEGVVTIGENAFRNNQSLVQVTIPNGTTTIGANAFYYCVGLKLLELPATITSIGDNAFGSCSKLFYLCCKGDTPSSVILNKLPNNSMMTLYVPIVSNYSSNSNWSAKFGDRIYEGGMIMVSNNDDGMTYVCATGSGKEATLYAGKNDTDITISGSFSDYRVKGIGREAFYNFSTIESLSIGENVTYICPDAFNNCSNLRKVVLPSTLRNIGGNAFKNCSTLAHVCCKVEDPSKLDPQNLPSNKPSDVPNVMMTLYVTNASTYSSNTDWKNKFEERIFTGDMTEVLYDNMKYICATGSLEATLYSGKNEETVEIPAKFTKGAEYTVKGIDRRAFYNCQQLVNLVVPQYVMSIGPEAFKSCKYLKTVTLPKDLKYLYKDAFSDCGNLARVVCKRETPPTISGYTVFSSTRMLYVPEGYKNTYATSAEWSKFAYIMEGEAKEVLYDNMNYVCSTVSKEAILIQGDYNATEKVIPEKIQDASSVEYLVKVIDNSAFKNYGNLVKLTIESRTSGTIDIGKEAFYNCSKLRMLTLPSHLYKIGSKAFNSCSKLEHVVCKSSTPQPIDGDVFSTKSTSTLYIPTGETSTSNYSSTSGWNFTTVIDCDEMEEILDGGMTYVCLDKSGSLTATLTKGVSSVSDVAIPSSITSANKTYNVIDIGKSAFNKITSLMNLTLSEGIQTIGANAFQNCTGLKRLVLPSSLTSIGNEAFIGCSNLTDIESKIYSPFDITTTVFSNTAASLYVPQGETENYRQAEGWKLFKNIYEGDRVVVIKNNLTYVYASEGETATLIKSETTDANVEIPQYVPDTDKKVTTIGKEAFKNNTKLVNLTISKGVETIGEYAFSGNTALANLTLPEGVKTIGGNAFQNCSNLKTVVLPSTLTSIGDLAFDLCKKIETLTSGISADDLFDISDNVFSSDIWPITAVYVPIGASTKYGSTAGWKNFVNYYEGENLQITIDKMTYLYLTGAKTATLTSTTSEDNDITIPGTFKIGNDTYTVTAINNSAFKGNTKVVSLKISDNIQTIGAYAFQNCSSLKKIEFPSTLKGIDEKAFDGCKNITHICSKVRVPFAFPQNVFSSYTASLYVPEGQEKSYGLTNYWNQFSNVVGGYFVNEVTQDNMTFDLMTTGSGESLKPTATLTKSATTTSTVTIPSKITFGNQDYPVTKIGPSSFSNNSKLVNLTIPENVQTIGENAFNGCNSIVNVISKITSPSAIPDNVFSTSSASLYVPQGTRDKYMSLDGWSRFTTVYEGVMGEKTVGDLSFVYATADKTAILVGTTTTAVDVVVPDSFAVDNTYYYVTAIDKSVFKGKTSIVNLTLPSTLKQIGDYAFDGCKNITTVVSNAIEPITMSDNAFSSYTATLYVPKDSRSKYQTATGWKNFATILEGVWKEVTLNGMTFLCATGDKTATLIKTTSTEKDVTIPGTFTDDGITYKVTAIDDAVFKNNTSLANLTISENVRTIGKYAFQGCSSLKKIELPSTLMGIGEKAFDGCKNITHICCKMMEPFGFLSNVFSLYTASLYVPEGQENSYKSTSYWNQFSTIVEGYFVNEVTQDNMTFDLMTTGSGSSLKTTATLTKSATTSSTVTIPSKISFGNQDYKVTKIGPSSFSNNSKIINLTIPENVQTIGENAFNGCNSIVNIISKIAKPTAIPDNVFSTSSASLYVPQGTRDKYMSLGGWSRFTTVYEGVMGEKTVGDMSFVYATADKTAILVGTTTTAADVVVPDSFAVDNTYYKVIAIDKSVFKDKTSIVNLTLPSTLKQIGEKAFDGCKNIVTIVSKATEPITMSENAFSSYTATLYVPKGSKSKYDNATGWKNFTILEGVWKEVTRDGMTFLCVTGDKTATLIKTTSTEKDVTILGTFTDDGITYKVTAIDDAVFKNNTSLVNLKISENVKSIGAYAFQGCSDLRRLELPSTLMYIEEKAFDGAKKLSHVCCKAKVAYDIDENVFSAYTAALYVPDGSLGTYQAKSGWNKFTNIYQGYFVDEMVSDNMTFVCLQNGEGEKVTTTAVLTKSSTTTANVSIPSSLLLNNVSYKVTTIGRSAFSNNSKLVNLTISENITTIEDNAFNGCMNIAVISSLIKEPSDFSENVFSAYTATLYVPVNTRSKYQAAKGWKNFGTILEGERNETTTEDGMTYIYATGDKTATLVKAAVSDKDLVISGTFKLGDVTYTVTAIDNSVFKGNKSIVNLKIAENIKTIGTNAFQNCVNLQKVELPSTLTGIGENAFGGCTRLSHIVSRIKAPFPINDNVFAESIYPTAKLYVPTVTSADYKNTTGWKNFIHILVGEMKEVTIDDLTYYCVQGPNIATLVKASTAAADVIIPATVKDGDVTYQVTEIGAYAFSGIGSLVKVTISEGITTIGIGAFQNCSKLERVVLPSTWTSIGDYAFDKCTRLSLVISNNKNPIWINDNVFSAYTAKVNVPVGTTDLYRNAGGWGNFQIFLEGDMKEVSAGDITYLCVAGTRTAILTKCSSKSKEITVPTSISDEGVDYAVVTIDESAFANNSNLVNLTISDGVKTIRNKAFSNCSYLNKVILPSTLTGIGDYAFEKCNRLSNIGCYIQKPLTISENVFTESTISNATLCVPDKTKSLYASADVWKDFNFIIEGEMQEAVVDGMTYICVPNQKWAKLIKGNSKAKEATVPGSITVDNISYRVDEIDRYAFASFASLESVTLSDGIQIIGETAFQNCYKLKKVVIPSSVTVFGSKAFEKCSKLQEVYYYREEPVALSDDVFPLSEVTLYVLISSVGKYQAAETWNQFKNIIGLETITVSSAGQLTYASAFDLDFSEKTDLKAYVATGYDKKTGTIWLTRVKDVAAGTGILLMGEAGKYDIPVMPGGSTSYYMNLFKGTLQAMTLQATDGANTNYYLSNGDAGVGFYKVTKEGGVSLAAHRAYLSVPTDIPAVGSAGGTETIKVSSAGQVPYYNSQSLDFGTLASQGVRAYTATGYNYSSGTIWLTRVMQVPAETGILIMAPEGSYDVPTASVATVYANMFKGTLKGTTIQTHETIAGEDYINYYLSNGDAGVGFYKVTKEGGVTLNPNRCYLPIRNKDAVAGTRSESSEKSQVNLEEADEVISISLLRGVGGDEDGTTSIRDLTPALSESEGEWYTLQGQRVDKPGKGLYIRNGKKVLLK